jgi:hypothetical protein
MNAFIAAITAVVSIAFIASVVLERQQRNADVAYTTSGARVDHDPRFSGGTVKH